MLMNDGVQGYIASEREQMNGELLRKIYTE